MNSTQQTGEIDLPDDAILLLYDGRVYATRSDSPLYILALLWLNGFREVELMRPERVTYSRTGDVMSFQSLGVPLENNLTKGLRQIGIRPRTDRNDPGNPLTDWMNTNVQKISQAAASLRPLKLLNASRDQMIALQGEDELLRKVWACGYAIAQKGRFCPQPEQLQTQNHTMN